MCIYVIKIVNSIKHNDFSSRFLFKNFRHIRSYEHMGGRAAEEIIFDEATTGASNDLERATKMAKAMVTQYGMSEKLGPLIFGEKDELVFLGKEIGEQRNYSEEIARQIDYEVRRIVENAYNKAAQLLQENRVKLEEIAERLLKDETLDAQSFEAIFA